MPLAAGGVRTAVSYHDLVDPCYPQRYDAVARHEVNDGYRAAGDNGHVLDQTMWNYHFEAGHRQADARRPGAPGRTWPGAGRSRTRCVYLQTAQDVAYDPAMPERVWPSTRPDLDAKRVAAIQKFLTAQTAGRRGDFQVLVHDPAEVGAVDVGAAREFGAAMHRPARSAACRPAAAAAAPAGGGGRRRLR